MNAYRLNEYEWWAADTAEQAIEVAVRETGVPREELVDDDFFTGEPENPELKVRVDDDTWPEQYITSRELLENMPGPGVACSTEY